MNAFMGGSPNTSDSVAAPLFATYLVFQKTIAINNPSPANAWVFTDEHADSINDGFFIVSMGQTANWSDLPANYHGGTGAFSFADGHAESKSWRDGNIKNRPVTGVAATGASADATAGDLDWVQQRTTALK